MKPVGKKKAVSQVALFTRKPEESGKGGDREGIAKPYSRRKGKEVRGGGGTVSSGSAWRFGQKGRSIQITIRAIARRSLLSL